MTMKSSSPGSHLRTVLLPGIAAAHVFAAQAQTFVLSDCDSFTSSNLSWAGQAELLGSAIRVGGTADESGSVSLNNPILDLSAWVGGYVSLTARVDPGNAADQIAVQIWDQAYLYTYYSPTSLFSSAEFTEIKYLPVSSPSYVADPANMFAFVGSGPAFAPDLTSVLLVQIHGDFSSPALVRMTFDRVALVTAVPEPHEYTMVSGGLLVLLCAWRRLAWTRIER